MITQYEPIFYPAYRKLKDTQTYQLGVVTRTYWQSGNRFFLFVNKDDLTTDLVPGNEIFERHPHEGSSEPPGYINWAMVRDTNYVDALYRFTETPATFLTNGLSHARSKVTGYCLTVDMCPSVNPFEQAFFDKLVSLSAERKSPFPVAICMSARWLEMHMKDFQFLLDQQAAHTLDITWVNHSFSHFYLSDIVDSENFLAAPFENLRYQMLAVEQDFINFGIAPAPFMRLPGLIPNSEIFKRMRKYGQVPLGADAWLNKGQNPTDGSIILVHGNGNEHSGIVKVMEILNKHDPKGWLTLSQVVKQ